MTIEIATPQTLPQLDFPASQDIAPENVGKVDALLSTPKAMGSFHDLTEQSNDAFRAIHPAAIKHILAPGFQDPEHIATVADYGVTSVEALHTFLFSTVMPDTRRAATGVRILASLRFMQHEESVAAATGLFARNLPTTAEIIEQNAKELFVGYGAYALRAAALAYWLELYALHKLPPSHEDWIQQFENGATE